MKALNEITVGMLVAQGYVAPSAAARLLGEQAGARPARSCGVASCETRPPQTDRERVEALTCCARARYL